MTHTELASLIHTSPAWIKRALRGDRAATRVRHRLASALIASQAQELGLTLEFSIAQWHKAMKEELEHNLTQREAIERNFVTKGIKQFISIG